MYTYKPRTIAEIKADIAELKIAIGLALDDDRADMESDLASLLEELDEVEVFGPFWRETVMRWHPSDLILALLAMATSLLALLHW